MDASGRPSFNALQNYGSSKVSIFYYLFDVLVLAGRRRQDAGARLQFGHLPFEPFNPVEQLFFVVDLSKRGARRKGEEWEPAHTTGLTFALPERRPAER